MATSDYLPVATGGGANVDTQAEFAGSGYQENGFVVGTARSASANKIWRQTSMVAAAVAKSISDILNIDILDDGNLPNLIASFKAAIAGGLGFTPVQQGTGVGQEPNAIKIGWDGARVRVTVDATDEGPIVFDSNLAPVSATANAAAAAATAAQTTANTAVANAATAQGTANGASAAATAAGAAAAAAQTTANTALADATAPRTVSVTDETGSRALNTVIENISGGIMFVSGSARTNPGGSVGQLRGLIGPANPPTIQAWAHESTASVDSAAGVGFFFVVPSGWFYEVTGSGDIAGISSWVETVMD
jgi:hypothetical protein